MIEPKPEVAGFYSRVVLGIRLVEHLVDMRANSPLPVSALAERLGGAGFDDGLVASAARHLNKVSYIAKHHSTHITGRRPTRPGRRLSTCIQELQGLEMRGGTWSVINRTEQKIGRGSGQLKFYCSVYGRR